MSVVGYEIIKPELTEVPFSDLRAPDEGEALLVHGVCLPNQIETHGGLEFISAHGITFTREISPWHRDLNPLQANLTEFGKVKGRLSVCLTDTEQFIRAGQRVDVDLLEEKALEVDLFSQDLLLIRARTQKAFMFHEFRRLSAERLSRLLAVKEISPKPA